MWLDIDRLADAYRDAGLEVDIEPGAHRRAARMFASYGYPDGGPRMSCKHHTAQSTSTSDRASIDYLTYNAPSPVMANVYPYKHRPGRIIILAAGGTYTEGKGGPLGSVPLDKGNYYSWSWECPNNGVGEPWPTHLQDTMVTGVAVEAEFFGWPIDLNHFPAHFEWAPGRKIDPSGSSRYAVGGNKWDMNQFRLDAHIRHQELYNPPSGGDDMPKTSAPTRVDSRSSTYQSALAANQTREVWLNVPPDTKFAVVNVVVLPVTPGPRGWCSVSGSPYTPGQVGTTVNWTEGASVAQSQVTIPVMDGKKVFLHSNRAANFVLDFTGTYW